MQYQKPPSDTFHSSGVLRVVKISLLIFLLGMCVVNKRKSTWPIVSWALYSEYSARFQPPEPIATDLELRVFTSDGKEHLVKPEHVLTVPRDSLSYKIIGQAFAGTDGAVQAASRQYLIRSLSILLRPNSDATIEQVQAWEMTYAVDPLSVPPFLINSPQKETLIGSFSQTDLARAE